MQRYVEGTSREQIQVMSFEDLIDEDNPGRVFDAFVDSLDMKQLECLNSLILQLFYIFLDKIFYRLKLV